MKHNDISNQRSYCFGFRCEGSLFKYRDHSFTDKFLNIFGGKLHRAEINPVILSIMKYIYWNTEYTVMLVIDEVNYTEEAKEVLEDLPFNQVATVLRNISEVTMMLNTGEMSYYIDDNDESRYKVQSKYAVTSQEFNTLLRKNFGRLT